MKPPQENINPEMNINQFLIDLAILSQKHGVKIEGCGCCGSPALTEIRAEETKDFRYMVNDKNESLTWKQKQQSN